MHCDLAEANAVLCCVMPLCICHMNIGWVGASAGSVVDVVVIVGHGPVGAGSAVMCVCVCDGSTEKHSRLRTTYTLWPKAGFESAIVWEQLLKLDHA